MSSDDDDDTKIPTPSTSFDAYQVKLQEVAVAATKSSMNLPKDLSYHRSLDRKFGKRADACSARILSLTAQLLEYAEAGNEVEGVASKAKGKRKLESEEDVVDGFHSLVVDIMDQLLERADTCLDEFLGRTKPPAIPINPQAQHRPKVTKVARGRLDPALSHASHLPKPQLLFRVPVDNANSAPWRPQLKIKHHAVVPMDQPSGGDNTMSSVPHPYQHEITYLTPLEHLLNPPSTPTPPEPLSTSPPVAYISHASQLPALLDALKQAPEIAVDLEYHSYRSFAGFVCLMQISTRTQDWIVDCLNADIRVDLECLNEVFADPTIVKVFHGAESDIVWLQQNFNLYIVNLFDTYHATKVLDFPKHSLAALLEMYCDFAPDKRYQLADWRIRPLPTEMLLYARSDTHFLLYIYDNLRNALLSSQAQVGKESPLQEVLKRSADTALRMYVREVYDAEGGTGAGGWEALGRKWNRSHAGGGVQATVFKALHAWRDSVARAEDESTRYVLPNHYVFQLAEKPPTDLPALLLTFQPVPPLVRTRSLELLGVIKNAVKHAALVQGKAVQPALVTMPASGVDEQVRVVGSSVGMAGLWERLRPATGHISVSSSLFGAALPMAGPSRVAYAAPTSSLFGSSSHASASRPDARYHELVARIHSTLVVAPSINKIVHVESAVSTSTANVKMQDTDPVVIDEIPFVPPAQRRAATVVDPNANDNIVVVGQRQKKRKRQGKEKADTLESGSATPSTRPKKRKNRTPPEDADAEAEVLEAFDYDAAPNLLDEPAPVAAARTKRGREKGGGVHYGNFPAPPRNMSEVKSGNQSRTFG